ncbi:2-oxo acid dehydrogenase subunit E2 [Nocardia crassostreae]|uniref:2-oxo acid dehydrogenase subunit E2 n=1 Tax=Nocardia crassostreae TaxID=53428 RepID=UPI00350E5753
MIRRLADEAGIDLHTVHGSAPGGRILRSDVEHAAAQVHGTEPPAPPAPAAAHPRTAEPEAPSVPSRRASADGKPTRKPVKGTRHRPSASPTTARDHPRRPRKPSSPAPAAQEPSAAIDTSTAPAGHADATVPPNILAAPRLESPAPAGTKPGGRASGYARRLAGELGVDVTRVVGSGPAGAVRAVDIRAAQRVAAENSDATGGSIAAGEAATELTGAVPTGGAVAGVGSEPGAGRDRAAMRSLIAAAMTRSKRTVPQYYLSATLDMDAATRWLREANRRAPVAERVLAPALLLRATALAARKVPQLNGFWVDDEFRAADDVHLGFVVSLRGGGIIVPTIPHADTLDVPAMMRALRGAVSRSRDGRLHAADATPATLTVTNLGDLGVDSVYGVIAVPQVAIVGFGAISERPCAVNGLLGVRPQLTATLSADHRASDGAIGARFLNTLSELLQHPEEL